MKRILSILFITLIFANEISAQCNVNITTPKDSVVCGDCIRLSTFGQGQGPIVFSENFNSGTPSGWAFTQQASFNNPCSAGGVDGTTHIWMGDQSGVPRTLQTQPYNFSTATSGATICFDMLFAEQGDVSPCEGPDEPQEGVYLQYSVGGGPWITINYFDPNGGTDPLLVNWNNWCFSLPPDALAAGVSIRWFQDADSGAEYDHWGIDNVQIYFNDPTFTISVSETGGANIYTYPTGVAGGPVPNIVCPKVNTTYYAVMSNTTGVTCRDSIRVVIRNPTIEVNAGQDITVCAGECATLNGVAKVIKSPAKTPTYSNTQVEAIQTGPGATTVVNINVTNLNMDEVLPNSITSVCITNLTYFGQSIFPPAVISIADLNLNLICPDGTKITLVPSGTVTGTQGNSGYTNTCFVPGGGSIASAASPYTGSFAPNQNFNGLAGCTANGVWSVEVAASSPLAIGFGTFSGWSISFDDPEISYEADFNWTPTANMTGASTPTPNVCPTTNTTYTLTASDTAGCITVTDDVTVTVQAVCCRIGIAASAVQPACGASNGSINLTLQGTGPYTFLWNDNNTSQNRTGLAAGTYRVTVTDQGQTNCSKDTIITLTNPGTLSLSLTNPVNPSCGANDGSVTVGLSGGTPGYTVEVDNGIGAPQTIQVPIAISQSVGNLPAGNYIITATDAAGCVQIQTINLTAPNSPTINSITPTAETCAGDNNGAVSVSVSGGNGSLSYSWSNSQAGSSISGLAPGAYSVTVTDASNCTVSATTSVAVGPVCCNISFAVNVVNPTCGNSDGSIDFRVVTGSGDYDFTWSNGAITEDISNVPSGNYTVNVNDIGQGCSRDTTIVLNNANGPQINSIVPSDETCAGARDGSINVVASGGAGALSYLWSNGATTASISSLATGQYTLTVTDANNCSIAGSATIVAGPACCNLRIGASSVNPTCGNSDGSIDIRVISGSGDYSFIWNNSAVTEDLTNIPIGTYNVTVTDIAQSCFRDTVLVLIENCGCEVAFPTGFSPNGDGVNDRFGAVYNCNEVKSAALRVFNRWGEKVFETNDLTDKWDGYFRGIAQPMETYIYYLNLEAVENNQTKTFNLMGNVTLIR
jgi:gliding motility-associated-like protein